jgi:hypothetical protein
VEYVGTIYPGNMAAVTVAGKGNKRKISCLRKNDYVPDTSEELDETRHIYQVLH